MPNATAKIVLIGLLLVCFWVPSTVVGYGGGGGGDGDSNTDIFSSAESHASGGVSWAPNPNGSDVMGSSIWDGRPENIHHGPYQPDKAVQDAEAELLEGLKDGNYTPAQVKEQLEWAQRVGIQLSPQAIKKLNEINNPPSAAPAQTSTSPSKTPAKPAKASSLASKLLKHKEDADVHLGMLQDFLDKANKGQQPTKTDMGLSYVKHKAKKWLKQFLPPEDAPNNQ